MNAPGCLTGAPRRSSTRTSAAASAVCIAIVAVSLLHAAPVAAQGLPGGLTEHTRISNPDTTTLGFGRTLAVDGDTMVVGAPQIGGNGIWRGAVYVYTRATGQWTLQQTLTQTDRWVFGDAVALSGDTLVATTEFLSGSAMRPPLVYVRTNGTWAQQAELTHDDPEAGSEAVVLAGDLALVETRNGGLFAYRRTGGVWSRQATLRPVGSAFVSLALDAGVLMVGVPTESVGTTTNQGAVHVYAVQQSQWVETARLTAAQGRANGAFGARMALHGDTAMVIGDGKTYVFARVGDAWTEQATLDPPVLPSSLGNAYPARVDLHGDVAVVVYATSAPYRVSYVYRRLGGRWTKMVPIHPAASTYTPAGIAIQDDAIFVGFSQWGNTSPYPSSLTAYPGKVFIYGLPTGALPTAPTLSGSTSGLSRTTINLSWTPGPGELPTSYQLQYSTEDFPTTRAVDVGATQQLTAQAPQGFYHLRVRGVNGIGLGELSNEIVLPVGYYSAPGSPTNLAARVDGSTVHFTWTPPSVGIAQDYVLSARLSPSGPVIAALTLGPTPAYSVPNVPPGTYYVTLQARDSGLASSPTPVVSFTVVPPTLPGAPVLNPPVVTGSTVTLSWTPGAGGSPAGFTLVASTTDGGAPIVTVPLSGTTASFASVPSGTYYLRLTATNAAGTSAPSATVTLVVP